MGRRDKCKTGDAIRLYDTDADRLFAVVRIVKIESGRVEVETVAPERIIIEMRPAGREKA